MPKKPTQVAITIPRSFAALAKAASTDPKGSPWLRSVLIEALPAGRVRGTAVDGFGFMRMEADVPAVQADLFSIALDSAPSGTRAAPPADDLAVVVKAVRAPKEGEPPPVEIVVGAEPRIRCGSESRRVQIEGDTALSGWPATLEGFIPVGDVVCAQVYSTERLRDLLSAILAADALTVKVELRGGLNALRLEAKGGNGEDVVGVLMPIKQPGEVEDAPIGIDLHDFAERAAAACRAEGMDVEVVKSKGRAKR
jgi:hypothetical protein